MRVLGRWMCLPLVAAVLVGCSAASSGGPDGSTLPLRHLCDAGPLEAPTDQGDQALCLVPEVTCDPAEDIQSMSQCHYPPSASPARTCCDPRPPECAPSDCDCLLRNGPWIDYVLAADAGLTLTGYSGPKRMCSYRVSCWLPADGGVAVLSCTPA